MGGCLRSSRPFKPKQMLLIKIQSPEGIALPAYESAGAAGMDVRAYLPDDIRISLLPGERAAIPTGLYVEIPEGFELQVRPRSGLAFKSGITVLNSPGTIDSDYRGEIKVILFNASRNPFDVRHGDRIAQLVLAPVYRCQWMPAKELEESQRGNGGFGSTGI
jgi:dUTP pyrophosphatase